MNRPGQTTVFPTPPTTKGGASITYLEAIRAAQHKLLSDDPRVFIYGQDIAGFGGAFKATKGLAQAFPGRVLDSPISARTPDRHGHRRGHRGNAAHYRDAVRRLLDVRLHPDRPARRDVEMAHGTPCPIVVRLPSGCTAGAGPFHSQSMEALYAHYPGLIVMTPATVEDAYTMLLEAVEIDDPVIFCEHKYLYYHLKAERLPETALPTGKARIARPGRDATIATYSAMVHESLACAAELAAEGWDIEVIDLRSVKPLDTDTVLASVSRTGRLLAVGEAFPWGGVDGGNRRACRHARDSIFSMHRRCA